MSGHLNDLIARLEKFEDVESLRKPVINDGRLMVLELSDRLKVSWAEAHALVISLDAVVALIEERLPGWKWRGGSAGWAEVNNGASLHCGNAKTLPCALLIAALWALAAEGEKT